METATTPHRHRAGLWVLFVSLALFTTVADLWSKHAVFELLDVRTLGTPPRVQSQTKAVVIPGFFELEANYNYGAFSGWFSDRTAWLTVLSAVALVVIVGIVAYLLRRPQRPSRWCLAALGLIWGGTLGNLHDRFFDRAVRDWIKWFVVWDGRPYVWPNFNIADSAICVGVSILVVLEVHRSLKDRRRQREKEGRDKKAVTPPNRR